MKGAHSSKPRHVDYFLGPGSRDNFHNGHDALVPVDLSKGSAPLREFTPPRLAITMVSEIDDHCFFSMSN